MNKMQIAHDMALAMAANGNVPNEDIIAIVWQYADAMQVEADERNKAEAEQKRKEVREILKDANTFIDREGQNFDDVEEWQPDWSQAPDGVTGWSMRSDGNAIWHYYYGTSVILAPSFGYTGDWRESQRRRPQ